MRRQPIQRKRWANLPLDSKKIFDAGQLRPGVVQHQVRTAPAHHSCAGPVGNTRQPSMQHRDTNTTPTTYTNNVSQNLPPGNFQKYERPANNCSVIGSIKYLKCCFISVITKTIGASVSLYNNFDRFAIFCDTPCARLL